MSGYLYNLRRNWRLHATPAQTGHTSAQLFVNYFGTTAAFSHVGLDGYRDSAGKLGYMSQLYAVFNTGSGPLPLTPQDIETIDLAVRFLPAQFPERQEVMTHMEGQIARARRELQIHEKTLAEINPRAAKPRPQVA